MAVMFRSVLFIMCVFSTLHAGSLYMVEIRPPQLISEFSDTKEAYSGKDFELECKSDKPIHWFYPRLEFSPEEIEMTGYSSLSSPITFSDSITNTGEYHSVLKVKSAFFLDTGYYYCIVNGTTDFRNSLKNVTHIYVYVRDFINLLVKNENFILQTVQQHQPAVIPCRPTSLDVNISLWKDGTMIPLGIHEEGVTNVIYDPTVGFTLDPVNVMHSGLYQCNADLGESTDFLHIHLDVLKGNHDVSFDPRVGFTLTLHKITDSGDFVCKAVQGTTEKEVTFHIIVNQATNYIPKPSLNESYLNPVIVGDKLYLECVARATKGIKFSIQWHPPATLKSGRAKYSEPILYKNCQGDRTYDCSMRSLTIENVTIKDGGNYTCQVIDHNKVTNMATKLIRVYDAGHSYINLTVDSLNVSVKAGEEYVQWVVNVDAAPTSNFSWFDKSHIEIKPRNSMKYQIQEPEGKRQIKLIINKISIHDAGTYEFHAFNDKVVKTLNLTLTVTDKPAVSLESNSSYLYQLHKNYILKCKIVGFPLPQVTWFFKDCDLKNECEELNFKQIQVNDNPEISGSIYVDTLEWTVEKPGYIKCFANNSEGSSSDNLTLFVTDMPNDKDLSIWGKPEIVVAGDNFTLHCGATKYNYTESLSWFEFRDGYRIEQLVQNNSGCFVARSDTEYSYRISLTWKDIPLNSDAQYICKATRNEDDTEKDATEVVHVKSPVPIRIVTNMNSSELSMESGSSLELTCFVSGLPVPTVKWYKDGIIIGNDSRIELRHENQTLYIQFAKLEDEGKYECVVSNKRETSRKSIALQFKDKPGINTLLIICIVFFCTVLVIMGVILCVKIRKERKLRKELNIAGLANFEKGAMESINPELPVDEQAELLPYDKKWEFPRDKLKLGKQLGAGAFGVVLKAEAWGIVEGELKSTVAVKMVKRNADRMYIKALASELKIMVHLGKHLNVVNLLGACTKSLAKMELLVVVEYCRFGNLHNYLLRHREDFVDQIDPTTGQIDTTIGVELLSRHDSVKSKSKLKYAALSFSSSSGEGSNSGDMAVDYRAPCIRPGDRSPGPAGADIEMNLISLTPTGEQDEYMLSNNSIQPEWRSNYRADYKGTTNPVCTHDLLCWAFQVARGMDYLASRKVMHGDLAARNVLLADDNIVKICDFGLAKSMYKSDNYRKKGDGPLPVKWMAIESIRDRVFSTQSDVWSYGIVLWEFFSLARTPYPGMEADEKLYNKLVDGYRMEQPQYATKEVYDVMMQCWQTPPVSRPSFGDLAEKLGNMLEESVKRHYIDLNEPYTDMNVQWMQGQQNDYLSMMNSPSYGNMVSPTFDDNDHEYVNSPLREETLLNCGESSGYLCMKSPTTEVIFSPRGKEGNVFSFPPNLQQQWRPCYTETESTEGMEQSPMLRTNRNNTGTNAELDHVSDSNRGLDFLCQNHEDEVNASKQNDSNNCELPSFSNPSYQSLMPVTSHDNYVNMPQQKKVHYDNGRNIDESQNDIEKGNISDPSFISTNGPEQGLNHKTSPHSVKLGKSLPNGMMYQNAFLNPNYQTQINQKMIPT